VKGDKSMDKHNYSKFCTCVECYKVKALIDITNYIVATAKAVASITDKLDEIKRKLK
jgi:hypothetical protein